MRRPRHARPRRQRPTARPADVEWDGNEFGEQLAAAPHAAPLLTDRQLQAGNRDASFFARPNVHDDKQVHVLVVSHHVAIGGGATAPAAACNPRRIMIIVDSLLRDTADVPPHVRCRRPGCARLYAQADAAATP